MTREAKSPKTPKALKDVKNRAGKKQGRIRTKIFLQISLSAALVFAIILGATFYFVRSSFIETKTNDVQEIMKMYSENLTTEINSMYSMANVIASDPEVINPGIRFEQKKTKLVSYAGTLGVSSVGFITTDGYLRSTDGFENDISDREYFKNLMNGDNYISTPAYNTATGKQIIFVGVPLKMGHTIVGAITCTFDSSTLSDMVSGIKYGGGGTAMMFGPDGTIIASPDLSQVQNSINVTTVGEGGIDNPSAADFYASVIAKVQKGESGYTEFGGNYCFYTGVEGSEGWTLFFNIPVALVTKEVTSVTLLFLIGGIFAIFLLGFIAIYIGQSIAKRVKKLDKVIQAVAENDFQVEISSKELNANDEIGAINRSMNAFVSGMRESLGQIQTEVSNLSTQAANSRSASGSLNEQASAQSASMDQIHEAMDGMSRSVEELAEHATNLAGAISDLTLKGDETGKTMQVLVDTAKNGEADMTSVQESMAHLNITMQSMNDVVVNVDQSAKKINQIVVMINEIAEQTNLLSLNASIEAARAGEAGRGFAVVADEIGKLANDSANATTEIAGIINDITNQINSLSEKSSASMGEIGSSTDAVRSAGDTFATIFHELEDAGNTMNEMINMMSEVSDIASSVAAISEEQSASAEEVSATVQEVALSAERVATESRGVDSSAGTVATSAETINGFVESFKI